MVRANASDLYSTGAWPETTLLKPCLSAPAVVACFRLWRFFLVPCNSLAAIGYVSHGWDLHDFDSFWLFFFRCAVPCFLLFVPIGVVDEFWVGRAKGN